MDEEIPQSFAFLESPDDERRNWLAVGSKPDGTGILSLPQHHRSRHMYVCGRTGVGKSRFLASVFLQDLAFNRPCCVLDPAGDLYEYGLAFVALGRDKAARQGLQPHIIERLLSRYLFLDLGNPDNSLRIAPLVPLPGETVADVVQDLLRTIERFFGRLDEQRRLKEVLGETFRVAAEINSLPESRRPPLPGGLNYPLDFRFAYDFLLYTDEQRKPFIDLLPNTHGANFTAYRFWSTAVPHLTGFQDNELIASSRRILNYFLDDPVAPRLFSTNRTTLDLLDVLNSGKSLFCRLPQGLSEPGAQVAGMYIANKLERAAYRRGTKWTVPLTIVLDEFHLFTDTHLAKAFAQSRQFGLQLVCAHQSVTQPPFDTKEGQSLLSTIIENSATRVVFQSGHATADYLVDEMLRVTHLRKKRTEKDRASTDETSSSNTDSQSDTASQSYGRSRQDGWRTGESIDIPLYSSNRDQTLSKSTQRQHSVAETFEFGSSSTRGKSSTTGASHSETITTREVYFTGDEERLWNISAIQELPERHCLISTFPLRTYEVRTFDLFHPEHTYPQFSHDGRQRVLGGQHLRLVGDHPLDPPAEPLLPLTPPEEEKKKPARAETAPSQPVSSLPTASVHPPPRRVPGFDDDES